MGYSFQEAVSLIDSVSYVSIKAAGFAWQGLAAAAGADASRLTGIEGAVLGDPGEGHAELAAGLNRVSGWAGDAGDFAARVGEQLLVAGDVGAAVFANRVELESEYDSIKDRMAAAPDVGNAAMRDADQLAALTEKINSEVARLADAFHGIQPGSPAAAPGSGGGGGGAPAIVAPGSGGGGAPPLALAANGTSVGAGDYPGSSVLGPEKGDFAGWVTDPRSGHLVDPATGREYDPASNRWIDPVTGKPFGDVAHYATNLQGVSGGMPTSLGTGAGVGIGALGTGMGLSALGGLYGGTLPPSLAQHNAASGQLGQQALRGLANKAHLATRIAVHEAGGGGRPFGMPASHAPTQTQQAPRAAMATRGREVASAWASRPKPAADRHGLGGSAVRSAGGPPPTGSAARPSKPDRKANPSALEEDSLWQPTARGLRGVLGD
ncbi:hypothetical protein LZ318_34050 [Saccharopolyspora indica]|uniref:hypothetical protein n=1 Tax=Saccharopolyspora indica TaxID=1229659 RepID=UPI0022EAD8AB|nr:hypothetical protein [Saccharopolyspora indica]MDA3647490.1 hypothetical protein [Saccharopolyspora indica]